MNVLCGRAVGEELEEAARLAAGNADRVGHGIGLKAHERGRGERCGEGAGDGGDLEAVRLQRAGCREPEADEQLPAEHDGAQEAGAGRALPLGRGEGRRNDHGAAMHDGGDVGVVELERVNEGAVEQGRRGCRQALRNPQPCAFAAAAESEDGALDPRAGPQRGGGEADTESIEQVVLGRLDHQLRNVVAAKRAGKIGDAS